MEDILLHWYHYTNLKPEDRGIFAKRIGGGYFSYGGQTGLGRK